MKTLAMQCPGCGSLAGAEPSPDGYECDCGEKMTVIDLFDKGDGDARPTTDRGQLFERPTIPAPSVPSGSKPPTDPPSPQDAPSVGDQPQLTDALLDRALDVYLSAHPPDPGWSARKTAKHRLRAAIEAVLATEKPGGHDG